MKKGYLGMFEGAYLAGKTAGYGHALKERRMSNISIPLDRMIYVAAFQGGIEKFLTPLEFRSDHPLDQFISARVSRPQDVEPDLLSRLLALRPELKDEQKNVKTWMATSLLYDLLVAMKNNAAVINVSGIPSLEDVKQEYPPDVAAPLCALLSALEPTEELLPAPAQLVSREAVLRFQDLLNSNVYQRYAAAHELVEVEKNISALSEVRSAGAQLLKQGSGVLSNRRVSMNIVSVVPKLVDAAFGKLPGSLAQFAADLASKFMEERKNIVVYQFEDWTNEYALASMSYSLKKSRGFGGALGVEEG